MRKALKISLISTGLFTVILFTGAVALAVSISTVQSEQKQPITQNIQKPAVDELLALTNKERVAAGLSPLILDTRLNASAQESVDSMVSKNYYSHYDPDTGKPNAERIFAHVNPNECKNVGENIMLNPDGYNTSENTIGAFMKSVSHRNAILNVKYKYVGFAIKDNYVAQHFCEPY